MTSLAAVLGSIMSELARARLTADTLTRELVNRYSEDPILRAMSVPHAVVGDVTLTLRFQIDEVQEAAVEPLRPRQFRDQWAERLRVAIPHAFKEVADLSQIALEQIGLAMTTDLTWREIVSRSSDIKAATPGGNDDGPPTDAFLRFDPTIPLTSVRRALSGQPEEMIESSTRPFADAWTRIPAAVREKLGGKARAVAMLSEAVREELTEFHASASMEAEVQAGLRSRLQVLVRGDDVVDPSRVQTLTLNLTGADLEVLSDTPGRPREN